MEKSSAIALVVFIALIVTGLLLLNWRSAQVIASYEERYSVNEPLAGSFIISLQEGDKIDKDTPITISLTKNNESLTVKTITIGDFISLSDNPVSPVKLDNGYFYDTPGRYSVEISRLIDYKFTEKGQYELFFSILKLDLAISKKITVD